MAVAFAVAACGPAAELPAGWQVLRPPSDVAALAVEAEVVWAGGRDGLFRLDRASGRVQSRGAALPSLQYVRGLGLTSNRMLWIAHGSGVAKRTDGRWGVISTADDAGACQAVIGDIDDGAWIGCENGLYRAAGSSVTGVALPPDAPFRSVDVLLLDRDGRLWAGSSSAVHGGLASLHGARWRVYGTDDGLPHRSVNGMYETRDGVLWVATGFAGRGGAAWFDGRAWHAVGAADGLVSDDVRSVYEDAAGRLWFASEFEGVAVFEGGRVAVLTPTDGLAGPEVKALAVDADGVYWIGTDRGLNRAQDVEAVLRKHWQAAPSTRVAEAMR